ncbi:Protein of unknown function [Caballeronia arationis]|uniref:DUF3293 domain-containing protein n=1 Tax=Caballeronia arationis TaxID=1777142 RepID=A0A7Z7I837_9BURK|nr:DUF3293 domain-containing protein [Caballeronia arationis]SOE81034.1 Protein of unknown function [Caballeronia arationis]
MTTSSNIDPATIRAYRETHYCVEGKAPITLRVGQRNEALAALHEATGVQSSAFVTAWNPFSQNCDDDSNARRQKALADELANLGFKVIEGVGRHPIDEWGEPSFLVLGISLEAAKELGARCEQNAIIWAGADAVPELVLLRRGRGE